MATMRRPSWSACARSPGCRLRSTLIGTRAHLQLHSATISVGNTLCLLTSLPNLTILLADEKYIFSNESKRYLEGKVARGPAIRSDASREDASANTTSVMISEGEWDCRAAQDSALRKSLGLETYRYFWAGNFTNISPVDWLGAFHWSDLLMIFGTYREDVGEVPELEVKTSETMQDHILAFLKNPSTVNVTVGWPAFDADSPGGGQILEFGKGTPVRKVTGDWLDGGCYNSSIPFRIWT